MRTSINPEKFSDFSFTNFIPHHNTGDITRYLNEDAVKISLKNLILTGVGERLFYPKKGSGVYKLLFELISPPTALTLENEITTILKNYEPRVNVHNVVVSPNYEQNGYDVTVEYEIINYSYIVSVQFFLERV